MQMVYKILALDRDFLAKSRFGGCSTCTISNTTSSIIQLAFAYQVLQVLLSSILYRNL